MRRGKTKPGPHLAREAGQIDGPLVGLPNERRERAKRTSPDVSSRFRIQNGAPLPANTPRRTCAGPEVVETEEFLAMLRFEGRDELQELMAETQETRLC
jgi:hypothetical protein